VVGWCDVVAAIDLRAVGRNRWRCCPFETGSTIVAVHYRRLLSHMSYWQRRRRQQPGPEQEINLDVGKFECHLWSGASSTVLQLGSVSALRQKKKPFRLLWSDSGSVRHDGRSIDIAVLASSSLPSLVVPRFGGSQPERIMWCGPKRIGWRAVDDDKGPSSFHDEKSAAGSTRTE
jgi:hypothetical protein